MSEVILFTASWCNPCKELKQWMESKKIDLDITFVDIDEEPLAAKTARIKVVPTLLILGTLHGGRDEVKTYLETLIKK